MRISAILPAAGSGLRLRKSGQTSEPKVYLPLAGVPMLIHSLRSLSQERSIVEIVVAVEKESKTRATKLIQDAGLGKKVRVVVGGSTRAESVYKALRSCKSTANWVLVHDAARPLLSAKALRLLLDAGRKGHMDGYCLATAMTETIKMTAGGEKKVLKTLDRQVLYGAQTPQLVRKVFFLKAFRSAENPLQMTDEASLIEAVGGQVALIPSDDWNFKITTYQDYLMADALLKKEKIAMIRVGTGQDIHRLEKGKSLILGGIKIPSSVSAVGHSDGDCLLHAAADALFGIAASGDIGEWFSDLSKKNKGINSQIILEKALQELKRVGYQATHLDATVWLEKPRLGSAKEKIKKHLAKLIGVESSSISIKAKTGEGLDAVGQGLAIRCDVTVTATQSGEIL